MNNEKLKITIEIDRYLYYRIQDAVNYYNLYTRFKDIETDLRTEHDFIIGSVVNFLEYVELFYTPSKHSGLIEQDKRPVKNTIKQYLKNHGIKQVDLSETTGIEKGNLSSMLNNNYQPSLDAFIKIWSALNFPPLNEILYREDEK